MNGKEYKQSRRSALKIITGFIIGLFVYLTGRFTERFLPERRKLSIPVSGIRRGINVTDAIFILKTENAVKVLSRTCPHLGCKLAYSPQKRIIRCPCHGSRFEPNGKYLSGPAKKDLKSFDYQINSDQLQIEI